MLLELSALEAAALVLAGFAIGAYASSIGAGGGFLLAPLLLWRYPAAAPAAVTTAALSVVVVSSGLAALLAARERAIDVPLAGTLAAAALPGAILGAAGTALLPRTAFAALFAGLLFATGLYLVWRPTPAVVDPVRRGWRRRMRVGVDTYAYRVPLVRSIAASIVASTLAALAGIGGGLIYTPLATRVMRVPYALAVPVAHVIITAIAAAVVVFHLLAGHAGEPMHDVLPLTVGVVAAAPLAQHLHRRLGEGALTRVLAAGLLLVAFRTALLAL